MRPFQFTTPLTLALTATIALTGCGSGSSGSSATTPVTPPAVTTLDLSGSWTGSYQATTGVAQMGRNGSAGALGCLLPLHLPAMLGSLHAAVGTRSVDFSITFTQANGTLTGSYTDTAGRSGTITGTITGTQVHVRVAFFSGASGTLDLAGTVVASDGSPTQAGGFTGTTVTEAFSVGGTAFTHQGPASIGDRLPPSTATGTLPADPASDLSGWWITPQTGITDQDHEAEGYLLEVRRIGDGYGLFSVFGQEGGPRPGNQTVTRSSTGAVIVEYRDPDSLRWNREVWSAVSGGSAMTVTVHDGGTAATAVWSDSTSRSSVWNRIPGPRVPTLGATSVTLVTDLSATTPPESADLTRITGTCVDGTVRLDFALRAAPDPAYLYVIALRDQVQDTDPSTAPVLRGLLMWDAERSAWTGTVASEIGWGPQVPLASGATLAATGTGLAMTVTRAAWATATGRTPTGGEVTMQILNRPQDAVADVPWADVRDLSPFAYCKLPAAAARDDVTAVAIPR